MDLSIKVSKMIISHKVSMFDIWSFHLFLVKSINSPSKLINNFWKIIVKFLIIGGDVDASKNKLNILYILISCKCQ